MTANDAPDDREADVTALAMTAEDWLDVMNGQIVYLRQRNAEYREFCRLVIDGLEHGAKQWDGTLRVTTVIPKAWFDRVMTELNASNESRERVDAVLEGASR